MASRLDLRAKRVAIRAVVAAELSATHARSRRASIEALERQLSAAGWRGRLPPLVHPTNPRRVLLLGDRVANVYAEEVAASKLPLPRGTERPPVGTLAERRAKVQAISENAGMWSEARAELVHDDLWKVWDATLDRRTCSVCADSDGLIVHSSEPFPRGEPGDVHPNCRCLVTYVTTAEMRILKR